MSECFGVPECSNTIMRMMFKLWFFMNANRLNGRSVVTSDDHTVGEVEAIHIDEEALSLTHLEVKLSNEVLRDLGFCKPFLGSIKVCLPITAVEKVGRVIKLNKTLSELKRIKECKM
jgi:sporulation protein YlmC with PRC-barrel domain